MRIAMLLCIAAASLSACNAPSTAPVQGDSDAANPYAFADMSLETGSSTLVDTGTGCEYVIQTLFQKTLSITPRNENAASGPRQICRTPRPGAKGFVLVAGGTAEPAAFSALVDRSTGCQYIVGTMFQSGVAATPRMTARGDERMPLCRRPG